jgi:arylsulfatase A-like enzyme
VAPNFFPDFIPNLAPGKRSLVLITVDCLRADHCGWYGYSRPTTLFLDSLAAESFVVPAAIVAGAPTCYSFPAIFASRMPLALGRDVVGLAPGESTLATVLREAGYATGAFSAANPYISARFGYDQGFEVFRDFLDFEAQSAQNAVGPESPRGEPVRGKVNRSIKSIAGAVGLSRAYNELYFQYCMKIAPAAGSVDALRKYPAADILVDRAQSWLASAGQRPFFLWLHLMDPHAPYYPPNEAFRELTGRDIGPDRARYVNEYWNRSDLTPSGLRGKRDEVVQLCDAGIRWVDRQIARLVQNLRQTHLWDDCVFALTADHGEEFLEHGGRYHSPVRLHEEIVRVPLLIRVPGKRGVKVPASPMSHLHLAPTLLEIMGVQAPPGFQGRSLWTNIERGIAWDGPAIIECAYGCTNPFRPENRQAPRLLGVRDARFKLVMRLGPGATEEVYDLETDPAETHPNVGGPALENRKRLLQAAREHMEKTVSGRDGALRLRARLRDLRYEAFDARSSVRNHRLEWKSSNS